MSLLRIDRCSGWEGEIASRESDGRGSRRRVESRLVADIKLDGIRPGVACGEDRLDSSAPPIYFLGASRESIEGFDGLL